MYIISVVFAETRSLQRSSKLAWTSGCNIERPMSFVKCMLMRPCFWATRGYMHAGDLNWNQQATRQMHLTINQFLLFIQNQALQGSKCWPVSFQGGRRPKCMYIYICTCASLLNQNSDVCKWLGKKHRDLSQVIYTWFLNNYRRVPHGL